MKSDTIAVCAIAKNEGPYLLEWIAHSKVIGFEKIIIYDNESTDHGPAMLKALAAAGEIDLNTWVWPKDAETGPQVPCYTAAVEKYRDEIEWIGFIDIDEFLVLKNHDNVRHFVEDYSEANGIAIHWKLFGSDGHKKRNDDMLVSERFTRCEDVARNPLFGRSAKSICRIDKIVRVKPHFCILSEGLYFNEKKRAIQPKRQPFGTHEIAQINHYFTKSYEEWLVKAERGRPSRSLSAEDKFRAIEEFRKFDRSHVVDTSIEKYREATKAEMARLKAVIDAVPAA